jgi:hypothetical protein
LQYQAAIQPVQQPWPAETHLARSAPRVPSVPNAARPLLARRNQPTKSALPTLLANRT